MTTVGFVKKMIAWCNLGEFHDGEWDGEHPCPNNPDCNDGDDHFLEPVMAFVCSQCDFAWLMEAVPAGEPCHAADMPLPPCPLAQENLPAP